MPQLPLEVKWSAALGRDYTYGNDVQSLVDGKDAFQAIYEIIQTAKRRSHFIYILAWWLDVEQPLLSGEQSTTLRTLLTQKAQAGVQIRVMVWINPQKGVAGNASQAHDTPGILKDVVDGGQNLDNYIADLEKSPETFSQRNGKGHFGIVKWINTLPNAAGIVDWRTATGACSHHQKLICVRGDQGILAACGGVDVNADRVRIVNPGKGESLHDVHATVRGPAASDLVHVFVQRWDAHPASKALDDKKGQFLGRSVPPGANKHGPGHIVRVVTTYNYRLADSEPGDSGRSAPPACKAERSTRDALLGAIKSAQSFIYIEDQYLVSTVIANALRSALKKLQFVIALTTASEISDLPQVWARRKQFIDAVDPTGLEFGFRVYYLWNPQTRGYADHTYVHAKTWIFDDELAYIGSANVNSRGLSSDSEVGIIVADKRWSAKPPYGFAQTLRMKLWHEHLGINVINPLSGPELWEKTIPASRVLPYDPDAGKDPVKYRVIPWKIIDPDMEGLPECKYRVQPIRMRQLK